MDKDVYTEWAHTNGHGLVRKATMSFGHFLKYFYPAIPKYRLNQYQL
eukprot:gene15989-4838_t